MSYYDAGAILIIFGIFLFAHYVLAIHPLHLLARFFSEFREAVQAGLGTTGAVNALGFMVVALIGALIFIEEILGSLL